MRLSPGVGGRAAAKLLFIGPGEGGVVLIAHLGEHLGGGRAAAQQLLGQQQPLFRQVAVDGIARLLAEAAHHVVLADVEPGGQVVDGQRLGQVQVQGLQQGHPLAVAAGCAYAVPGAADAVHLHHQLGELGLGQQGGAVAALDKYPTPIIMIDMGTATTISYISSRRSYEGGLMFPGVRLSLDALSDHTAQLPDISLQHPKQLIGKNTEDCMRSGIVYGTAGMLDGVIDRIREQFSGRTLSVVATGGNAPVIVKYCRNKIVYDKYLLMDGLWAIYQKNK